MKSKNIDQTKYICPHCKSKNLVIWEQNVVEHLYKIKKDGKPYKKPFSKEYTFTDVLEGLKCLDCNENINYVDDDYQLWLRSEGK